MAGPAWSDDSPGDAARILTNLAVVVANVQALAVARETLTATTVKGWHRDIYAGCTVPSPEYVGRFRGEPHPDLDYEVGVGPLQPDGLPLGVGVWAAAVAAETAAFFTSLDAALAILDGAISSGARPTTADHVGEVVEVIAQAHGEWVRIHPFVNGNGRTARLIAAHVSVRYGLPIFVSLKPRPHDVAYVRVATASMGRPPQFVGDHEPAKAVFSHLLALKLLRP